MTAGRLTIRNHDRDTTGMTYVYAVLSRRAGGVSVGINLNPNNACNWRCIYCQVPDLKRGGPPPIDLAQLESELRTLLTDLYHGDYLARHAPPEAQRVVDIAFSGNGEPTSAPEFADAIELVGKVRAEFGLAEPPCLRVITNGSQLGKASVCKGIARLGQFGGEVWFKIDAVGETDTQHINGIALAPETVLTRLKTCAGLCPTWIQTCLFALDGVSPDAAGLQRYLDLLAASTQATVPPAGVHLYSLARPSRQTEATRLASLPAAWLHEFARRIEQTTGLSVRVSP